MGKAMPPTILFRKGKRLVDVGVDDYLGKRTIRSACRRFPVRKIDRLAKFVRPPGTPYFQTAIVPVPLDDFSNGFHGCVFDRDFLANPIVRIYIGARIKYPEPVADNRTRSVRRLCMLRNDTETMLFLLAHEARHVWQSRNGHGIRWHGPRHPTEIDADLYGRRMLNKYRLSCKYRKNHRSPK